MLVLTIEGEAALGNRVLLQPTTPTAPSSITTTSDARSDTRVSHQTSTLITRNNHFSLTKPVRPCQRPLFARRSNPCLPEAHMPARGHSAGLLAPVPHATLDGASGLAPIIFPWDCCVAR